MNIKQLKQKIENLPDSMDVFVGQRLTDFTYGFVNSAQVEKIGFAEDPNSKTKAYDKVLVIME